MDAAEPIETTGSIPAVTPGDAAEQAAKNLHAAPSPSTQRICSTLEVAAGVHDLPLAFFVRLIWQESRFNVKTISRAGARGIAQFMPGTARLRGLADPFDPIQSLHKSADFLRELRVEFGNLGLAAAAYNGGPGRVQRWLEGRGGLPRETRDYVRIVTGSPVEQWRDQAGASAVQAKGIPEKVPCPGIVAQAPAMEPAPETKVARHVAAPRSAKPQKTAKKSSWSVQLTGKFSRKKARAHYARLKRKFKSALRGRKAKFVKRRATSRGRRAALSQVRIAEDSRRDAEQLCAQLRAGGASCTVVKET
ncbi:MAG: transglycosylase SLT domain-containing protein [Xanthobacteraceae bacterium]